MEVNALILEEKWGHQVSVYACFTFVFQRLQSTGEVGECQVTHNCKYLYCLSLMAETMKGIESE